MSDFVPAQHLARDGDRMNLAVLQRIDKEIEKVDLCILPSWTLLSPQCQAWSVTTTAVSADSVLSWPHGLVRIQHRDSPVGKPAGSDYAFFW